MGVADIQLNPQLQYRRFIGMVKNGGVGKTAVVILYYLKNCFGLKRGGLRGLAGNERVILGYLTVVPILVIRVLSICGIKGGDWM